MKKLIPWFTILTLGMLFSSFSFATADQKLQQYFRNELRSLNQSVAETNSESHGLSASNPEEAWMFSSFMIRVRPKFGFEIPELASFYVIPDAELVWQQSMPQGWDPYRPSTRK